MNSDRTDNRRQLVALAKDMEAIAIRDDTSMAWEEAAKAWRMAGNEERALVCEMNADVLQAR